MGIFLDPLALSRTDEDHGADEERWVTIGRGRNGKLLLVVHTYSELELDRAAVRIISAREAKQYEEGMSA